MPLARATLSLCVKRKLLKLFHWLFDEPKPAPDHSGGKRRIAFITRGSFSHANERVLEVLKEEFPEFELERIEVADILQEQKSLCLLNFLHTLRTYAGDLLARRRSFRDCFYRTPFLFAGLKATMRSRIKPGVHVFSLQTQSLLDFSVPGVPHFVYTDHTHLANLYYAAFDRRNLFPSWWIDLERSIYANAAKVFVMTQHVKRTLIEEYHCEPSKVSCILAGGNLAPNFALGEANTPSEREQRILFVGINWERKGGPHLLASFLAIAPEFPRAKLVIVGCNPPLKYSNVEILGKIPLEAVQEEYLKAQLFAFPTRIEPFGFVVAEAMAHGLPVVGTAAGIMADMVRPGENGTFVELGDVPGLASALADLLRDPEKRRLYGENGYRLASKDYTWKAVGGKLHDEIVKTLQALG